MCDYRAVNYCRSSCPRPFTSQVVVARSIRNLLTEHTDLVSSVDFNPDGKTLASGSYDETIIWDVSVLHAP